MAKADATDSGFTKLKKPILDSIHDIFLSKACLTVIGFLLKSIIVSTLQGTGVEEESGDTEGYGFHVLPSSVFAYIVLVFVVVLMKSVTDRYVMSLTMSASRQETIKTLVKGLELIPAWGFKDCVACLIAGRSPIIFAFLVVLAATLIAVVVEPPRLEVGEFPDVLFNLRKTLSGCMALGVGFAFHTIPPAAWAKFGLEWLNIPVMLVYAPLLTVIVVLVQLALTHMLEGDHSRFYKTLLTFLRSSGNFLVAWGWDGLVDILRKELLKGSPHTCLSECLVNLAWANGVVLICLVVIVISVYTTHENNSKLEKGIRALLPIVLGMVVAWSFLDWMVALYNCAFADQQHHLLRAWLLTLAMSVIVASIMLAGSHAVERLQAV